MRRLTAILITSLATSSVVMAQSALLESVKRNPKEAIALCKSFRQLNAQGISSSSKEVIKNIAQTRNLSSTDAEILSIYVIGMNCPDVR